MRAALYVTALTVLSACGDPRLPLEGASVRLTEPSRIVAERKLGIATSTIRTYVKQGGGTLVEVAGATCGVSSVELRGSLQTPQAISYPRYIQAARFENRGAPLPILVTCQSGSRAGSAVFAPVNEDRSKASTTTAQQPGQVTVSTVTMSANVSSSYPWVFPPDMKVTLE